MTLVHPFASGGCSQGSTHFGLKFSKQLLCLIIPHWPTDGDGDKVRPPIEPERALSYTLLRLAHNESTFHNGNTFGIGESTVRKYCHIIVDILATKLCSQFISIPSGERLRNIIADFQTLNLFSNVCGAIDGSHIKLARRPNMEHIPAQCWCRHHFHSVLLQAICDLHKRIWDVCVLAPGGTNDAAHWKASSIYKKFRDRLILQDPVLQVHGVCVSPYLLADSGYGACRYLITPFREGSPPESGDWRGFNCHLSKGRVRIEHVFGMLKHRWRILRDINMELERVPKYVVACCVLHNILTESGQEELQEEVYDPHPNQNNEIRNILRSERVEGQELRNAIFQEWSRRVQVLQEIPSFSFSIQNILISCFENDLLVCNTLLDM
ncbi:hypothetical protein L7F22_008218 [Adiantum nelumboides]|nr:hypothetical protein [Adiantum nelumboides]